MIYNIDLLAITICIGFIIYQKFLKPNLFIKAVPGPFYLKLSSIVPRCKLLTGQFHEWIHRLHLKYGPIVQFSPYEVSIITKEGVDSIYNTSKFFKPDFYRTLEFGGPNIGSMRDRDRHMSRKRLMSKAYSKKSLIDLETKIHEVGIKPLEKKLELLAASHEEFDIYTLGIHYFFDLISVFSLSERIHLITKEHYPIKSWILDSQFYSIFKYSFPNIKFGKKWTGKEGFEALQQFCRNKISIRRGIQSLYECDDVLNILLKSQNAENISEITDIEVTSEIILQFLAGVEATGSTLAWTINLLLKHPKVLIKLQKEIDQTFLNKDDALSFSKIQSNVPYLKAIIFESLRLYPIFGGFIPRMVPKDGYNFSGYFIPPGFEVGMSGYSYHRSPLLWKSPNEFNPDRFLGTDGQLNRAQLMIFLKGPHGCLGRELAVMGLSLFIATLVRNYNISIDPEKLNFNETHYLVLKLSDNQVLVSITPRN